MKRNNWKIAFLVAIVLLFFTNIFWLYNVVDAALAHDDYKTSCDGYYKDMLEFKKILLSKEKQADVVLFLDENKVQYERFQSGDDFIIQLNSFVIFSDKDGNIIKDKLF